HYNWAEHRRQDYAWWIARFAGTFRLFDAIRIDHFLGFHRLWEIAASSPSAADGKWIEGPGVGLFNAVRAALGPMPIIAEDLGPLRSWRGRWPISIPTAAKFTGVLSAP